MFNTNKNKTDIEKDIDEKGAARVLEESTKSLPHAACVFTVVPNAFSGLEFTETTCFDMIFVRKDLDHLDAVSFLRILRNVGAPMDVVLLLEPQDSMTEEQARSIGFYRSLRKEYQAVQICAIVTDIMAKQENTNLNQNQTSPRVLMSASASTNAMIAYVNGSCSLKRSDPPLSEAIIHNEEDEEEEVVVQDRHGNQLLTNIIRSTSRPKRGPLSSVV